MSPRANRYMQDNYVYHLTARCHDRSFLFKFGRWRGEYRRRLRTALPVAYENDRFIVHAATAAEPPDAPAP